MNKPDTSRFRRTAASRGLTVVALIACLLAGGQTIRAATWHGIEPLKSRRADVERELGQPVQQELSATNSLNFKVAGGMVTVTFVDAKFVQTKKLAPDVEGTVLLIVLRHDNSSDTPESLALANKNGFSREEKAGIIVFYNQKDGITYTFINGRLKTTRYAAATEQLLRAQRG
ncbi:MAG: hypothetical protein QOE47_1563 [Pyrinomonadaceae bacterium]|jgi:hypothetical protein|nr:hypothetical protein [Pyrinomonadaceae bacterium]